MSTLRIIAKRYVKKGAKMQWISVKEKVPEKSGYIIVSKDACLPFIGMYHMDTGNLVSEEETYSLRWCLTHWAYIPPPPS